MKIIAVIYATFVVAKRKPEKKKKKKTGLYGIRTLDHRDTGAALYQLQSNQVKRTPQDSINELII